MKKIILFSFLFFAFYFNVRAAHLDLYKIDGVYSSQYNIDTGSYFSSNQKKYVIDGRVVYCVEPGMNIMTREYSSFDLSYSNFSNDILNKINLIGYFGYDYPGHSSDRYFMAAQELIWEMIGNNEVHFTTGINDSGNAIDIEYEKNEIMDLVNDYYLKPSFDLNSYDGMVGEKIVLSDQNHVLSDYDVISAGAYIDGDNLIIDVLDEGIRDIKLVRKKYDNLNSVFYQESGSQDFMFLRPDFDVESIVSINGYIPYSSVSIYKTGDVLVDYTDDFVYEERGLDNISFGLYSDEDIYVNGTLIYNVDDLVDELVTVDGYASSINIPNGKYYLRELDTYDYLIISDDIHFEINNINNYIYKYDLEIKNDRKNVSVSINKNGEVFDDLDNSHYEPLEGVKFGLYSHDDIYSYDNELLISKDSLIYEYVTDSDGSIYIDNLPISSYYFKELETYEYYVLDNNIYDVFFDDYSYELYAYNYLKRGSLDINKYSSSGEILDGACFALYWGDELIYEGTTVNGFISIDNLPYGQYKLYELSAPQGYIKNNDVFDILINDSIVNFDIYNEKLPVTSDIYFGYRLYAYIIIFLGVILYGKKVTND